MREKSKCSHCRLLVNLFVPHSLVIPPLCSSIALVSPSKRESPDDSDNNNGNYNDNDSDKNNYNVEIIRNCRSTIAIFSLLLLSLHGGWLKYIYFLCMLFRFRRLTSASRTGEQ